MPGKTHKETFDKLEYFLIRLILILLLVIGGIALLWHAVKIISHI